MLRRLGPLVGVMFLLSGGLILLLERSLLYPAQHMTPRPPVELPPGAERWWFEHAEGSSDKSEGTQTAAHFYPGDGVDEARPGPVVLFAHGNAEFIEDYDEAFPMYRKLGVSVLLVEYRGCGHSTGKPTKTGITEDHVAFFDRLAADPRVDPARIVLHGRSMGGGIVAAVAEARPAAAAPHPREHVHLHQPHRVEPVGAGLPDPRRLGRDRGARRLRGSRVDRPLRDRRGAALRDGRGQRRGPARRHLPHLPTQPPEPDALAVLPRRGGLLPGEWDPARPLPRRSPA